MSCVVSQRRRLHLLQRLLLEPLEIGDTRLAVDELLLHDGESSCRLALGGERGIAPCNGIVTLGLDEGHEALRLGKARLGRRFRREIPCRVLLRRLGAVPLARDLAGLGREAVAVAAASRQQDGAENDGDGQSCRKRETRNIHCSHPHRASGTILTERRVTRWCDFPGASNG